MNYSSTVVDKQNLKILFLPRRKKSNIGIQVWLMLRWSRICGFDKFIIKLEQIPMH